MHDDRRFPRVSHGLAWVITCGLALAVAVLAVSRIEAALSHGSAGLDFWPLRAAAQDLLQGQPVYSDPMFVYPPSAAIAFLPLTWGGQQAALSTWVAGLVVSVVVTCLLVAWASRLRQWPAVAFAMALGLLATDAFAHGLWLANLSVLLAPTAVGVLLLFERERWTTGTALLMTTLLVKPLLAPLLLLPLLARQWRAVGVCLTAGLVALGATVLWVPGGRDFAGVVRHLAGGSVLRQENAVYNLSFRGLADRLDQPTITYIGSAAVLAVAISGLRLWRRDPRRRPGDTSAAGAVLLTGVFLAGPLSEVHFLLVALPLSFLAVALSRSAVAATALGVTLLIGAAPRHLLGSLVTSEQTLQVRYVLLQCLLLLGAYLVLRHGRSAPRQSTSDEPSGLPERVSCEVNLMRPR